MNRSPDYIGTVNTETVTLEGHIIDSLILAKVLDRIVEGGANYRIVDFQIGRTATDMSKAVIEVAAADENTLSQLLSELKLHGANRVEDLDRGRRSV